MNHQDAEREPSPETGQNEHPRIYVADLAAYNNGHLHGTWIDATEDAEDLWDQIHQMLARSPIPGAEEHAIHDYDNFGPLHLSEYESIDTIARIGQGAVRHGRAFLHWVAYIGTGDSDSIDLFEDCFMGHYASLEELGEELADAHGIEELLDEHVPEFIRPYVQVDYASFGQDLASSFYVTKDESGVYVYEP